MKRFFQSEVGAVLLWVAASLVLAAVIAPWLYQVGKGFAFLAKDLGFTGVCGWFGEACQQAEFSRYYNRSLLLAAVLLLPILLKRHRQLCQAGTRILPNERLYSRVTGVFQCLLGLLLAGSVGWGLGALVDGLGAFTCTATTPTTGQWLTQALIPALVVSGVEEWLFRGLLLGLWLRVARPATACIGTSLVFAFVHFLAPMSETDVVDPTSAVAGLHHLWSILLHFAEPRFLAADFLTLFTVGWILAMARLRTQRLWLSIGLHSGWVIAFKIYNLTHLKVLDCPVSAWWIGGSLRSGLLPLIALGLTAGLCHLVFKTIGYQSKVNPV